MTTRTLVGLRGRRPFYTVDDYKSIVAQLANMGENPVVTEIIRANGFVDRQITQNIKTNAGIDFIANQIGNSAAASASAVAKFMGLSSDPTAPAATDTVLAGEITLNGLARQAATFAHTNGTATFTQISTWSSITGTQNGIHKTGLFTTIGPPGGGSPGTLVFETVLAADKSVSAGDTLTITWTGALA